SRSDFMNNAAAVQEAVQLIPRRHCVQRRPSQLVDNLAEGVLHVLRLLDLVIRPFPVKAQHRNSISVDDARVDLAIAIVVCNHLAAAGEAHDRAPKFPVIAFESFSVAAYAVVALDIAHESEGGGGATSTTQLDVVSAREVELLVIQPPWHVEMHTANTVFVVRHTVGHFRNVSPNRQTG